MEDLKNPPAPPVPSFERGSDNVTIEQLRATLPLKSRSTVTQKMVDLINSSNDDSAFRESFKDNVLTWASIMSEGKYKFSDYICAVKYVSHKLMGDGHLMAYAKVFPNRYQRLINKGCDSKTLAAYAAMYNKGELVTKITERTLIPIWVLNSDLLQEAINVQAVLMRSAKSETVRHKASNSLIEHLKQPEAVKVQLDVGYSNDTVEDLRAITLGLARQQQKMIAGGHVTANDIAASEIVKKKESEKVIEAEFEEIEKVIPVSRRNRLVADFYKPT